jgi:hypothetical protein
MRTLVIFYAWQSDRPNNINRGIIEKALDDAVKQFNASSQEFQIKIDQDTQGVSGMPPVSETILEKIRNYEIFLPDLTFVTKIEDGDKAGQAAPNPNVLIEFGYALSAKGHSFLMPVMNVAFEGPSGLPFDMGHLRHPILYRASPSDDQETRRKERARLSAELLSAIKTTIGNISPTIPGPAIGKEMKAWAADHHSLRTSSFYQLISVPLIAGPKLLMQIFPVSAYEETDEIDFSLVSKQSQNFAPFDYEQLVSQPDVHSWRFFAPPSTDRNGMFPGRIDPAQGQLACTRFG